MDQLFHKFQRIKTIPVTTNEMMVTDMLFNHFMQTIYVKDILQLLQISITYIKHNVGGKASAEVMPLFWL